MNLLTISPASAMLCPLSQKTEVGPINTLRSNGVKTPIHGVFYCPQKIITALVRPIVMVARSGLPKGGPAPLPGVDNPLRVAAQTLSTFWRRFIHFEQWSSAMCHYAQSAPKLRLIPRQSLFNLVKRTDHGKQVIGTDLTFEQVSGLLAEYPALIVKFSRMEVRNGR
jgi:hypothetical protein